MIESKDLLVLILFGVVAGLLVFIGIQNPHVTCVADEATINHVVSVREFNPNKDYSPATGLTIIPIDSNYNG